MPPQENALISKNPFRVRKDSERMRTTENGYFFRENQNVLPSPGVEVTP